MSNQAAIDMGDIHWLMDILQNIDAGLVVLNRQYDIQLWNGFMESHSGISPQIAKGRNLFELFPEIPEDWFRQKTEPVFQLKTRTFTIWEQRPWLFHFKNYRPITGRATFMYQNTAIIPLESINRSIDHICVIIYDVTDMAISRKEAASLPASCQQCSHELQRPEGITITRDRHVVIADASQGNADDDPEMDRQLSRPAIWAQLVEREQARCQRSRMPSSLVMMQFASDNVGPHQQALLADLLVQSLRQSDAATRIDDETLMALLVDSDEGDAMFFAERIRKSARRLFDQQETLAVCVGIARWQPELETAEDWQLATAEALMQARHNDNDQVRIFSD